MNDIASKTRQLVAEAEAVFAASYIELLLGQRPAPAARHAAPFAKSDAGRERRANRRATIARKWEYVLGE